MGAPNNSSAKPSLRNLDVVKEESYRKSGRVLGGEEKERHMRKPRCPKSLYGISVEIASSLVG